MNSSYWMVTFETCSEHAMGPCVATRIECLAQALAGTTQPAPIVTTSDLVRRYGEQAAIWIHGKRTPANLRALGRI